MLKECRIAKEENLKALRPYRGGIKSDFAVDVVAAGDVV